MVLCDRKRFLGLGGVGDFYRFDVGYGRIDHKHRPPELNVGIEIGSEVANKSWDCNFARSFCAREIHICSVLGWRGESNV